MKHLVTVTQEDIDKGDPSNCQSCPIAWAVARKFKPFVFRSVKEDELIMRADGSSVPLPRSARRFIKRFDRRRPVKPFRFYVQVPNAA